MGHIFADDIDADLYALIRVTSVERIYDFVRARERLRDMAEDLEEEAVCTAPTEAPSSDTMPVSYIAPTSRPAGAYRRDLSASSNRKPPSPSANSESIRSVRLRGPMTPT